MPIRTHLNTYMACLRDEIFARKFATNSAATSTFSQTGLSTAPVAQSLCMWSTSSKHSSVSSREQSVDEMHFRACSRMEKQGSFSGSSSAYPTPNGSMILTRARVLIANPAGEKAEADPSTEARMIATIRWFIVVLTGESINAVEKGEL